MSDFVKADFWKHPRFYPKLIWFLFKNTANRADIARLTSSFESLRDQRDTLSGIQTQLTQLANRISVLEGGANGGGRRPRNNGNP